jgi:hypothetical protein
MKPTFQQVAKYPDLPDLAPSTPKYSYTNSNCPQNYGEGVILRKTDLSIHLGNNNI